MRKIQYIIYTLCVITGLFSCKTNIEGEIVKSGTADFSKYVAIGNSFTAGYADGALYKSGQMNSYPNMLAEQFKWANGGEFKIPYMNDGAGSDVSGNPRRVLGYVVPCGSTTPTLSPVYDPLGVTPMNNVAAAGPYNLIGVPGARAIDANSPLYSSSIYGNPFLKRFCQTLGTSTMMTEALRNNPTFFTLWLGTNDVLLYALGGSVYGPPPFSAAISDSTSVRLALTQVVDTLTKRGAKGAIANLPDITSIPYFTTVPWNGAVLTAEKAAYLNHIYDSIGLTMIDWVEGANGFMIVDSSSPTGYMRHATANDLILLTTPGDSLRCGSWGTSPSKPLKDKYVLDISEIAEINEFTASYNTSIANLASQYNLAFVDMKSFMKTIKSGIIYNGVSLSSVFVSGGAFSLDGVHPNARGYALLANEFIKAINLTYKSTIPGVDPIKYNGIIFP